MNTLGSDSQERKSSVEVYILKCADGSYFIGHARNMLRALKGHMAGMDDSYTATRLPVTLEFCESFESLEEALAHKKKLQSWSRTKKQAYIAGGWEAVRIVCLKQKNKKNNELIHDNY